MNTFDDVLDENKEYFHALSVKPVCIGSQSAHKDSEFLVASGPNVPPKIHNFLKGFCNMCQVKDYNINFEKDGDQLFWLDGMWNLICTHRNLCLSLLLSIYRFRESKELKSRVECMDQVICCGCKIFYSKKIISLSFYFHIFVIILIFYRLNVSTTE